MSAKKRLFTLQTEFWLCETQGVYLCEGDNDSLLVHGNVLLLGFLVLRAICEAIGVGSDVRDRIVTSTD